MQENEDFGLVFKTNENAAQPATVPAEVDGLLSDAAVGAIADVIGDLTAGYEKQVGELRRQVDQLTGKVDALLSLLQSKGADIVSLPARKTAS